MKAYLTPSQHQRQSHGWTDPLIFVKDEVVFDGDHKCHASTLEIFENVIFVFRTHIFGQFYFEKRKEIANYIQLKVEPYYFHFFGNK